jgi:hypothetical protein
LHWRLTAPKTAIKANENEKGSSRESRFTLRVALVDPCRGWRPRTTFSFGVYLRQMFRRSQCSGPDGDDVQQRRRPVDGYEREMQGMQRTLSRSGTIGSSSRLFAAILCVAVTAQPVVSLPHAQQSTSAGSQPAAQKIPAQVAAQSAASRGHALFRSRHREQVWRQCARRFRVQPAGRRAATGEQAGRQCSERQPQWKPASDLRRSKSDRFSRGESPFDIDSCPGEHWPRSHRQPGHVASRQQPQRHGQWKSKYL